MTIQKWYSIVTLVNSLIVNIVVVWEMITTYSTCIHPRTGVAKLGATKFTQVDAGATKFTQVDAGRGQNVTFDPLYLENFLELECHRCLMAQP